MADHKKLFLIRDDQFLTTLLGVDNSLKIRDYALKEFTKYWSIPAI